MTQPDRNLTRVSIPYLDATLVGAMETHTEGLATLVELYTTGDPWRRRLINVVIEALTGYTLPGLTEEAAKVEAAAREAVEADRQRVMRGGN